MDLLETRLLPINEHPGWRRRAPMAPTGTGQGFPPPGHRPPPTCASPAAPPHTWASSFQNFHDGRMGAVLTQLHSDQGAHIHTKKAGPALRPRAHSSRGCSVITRVLFVSEMRDRLKIYKISHHNLALTYSLPQCTQFGLNVSL